MADIKWSSLFPHPTSEIAKICLNNLNRYWSGEFNYNTFVKEQNYTYLMVLDEMKFLRYPTEPFSLEAFNGEKNNPKFDSCAYFKSHPELSLWMDRVSKITWDNFKNATKLEELIKYFGDLGDSVSAGKCGDVYNDYSLSIYLGDRMIWKKK